MTRLTLLFPAALLFSGLLAAIRLISLLLAALVLLTGLPLLATLVLLTGLPLLATLVLLAVLLRPLGPLLAAALLAAPVLLAGTAFISVRLAGFAAVLEVRFGAGVRCEAALVTVLALALPLRSSLPAPLGLHSGAALALVLPLFVPLTATGAVTLLRLGSGPAPHPWFTGRLFSFLGPPGPGRFLVSIPIAVLTLLLGSPASHFAAPTRGALQPAAVAVALSLVLVALVTLTALIVLVSPLVVLVRSVLP
ncbi:hypothetical protein [Halopiger aswanensis]|uniref:hypothetical protein n=1 Tax=Halopiger aswanensis TaxID=148449 RepID=UPI000E70DC5A|nr:hypothetical protein [Halopiger aswanensis]